MPNVEAYTGSWKPAVRLSKYGFVQSDNVNIFYALMLHIHHILHNVRWTEAKVKAHT